MAARVQPSARGELEITDLNRIYLEAGDLRRRAARPRLRLARRRHPGFSLLQAATFVQTIQSRQGMLVGCPEEVAFRMGWIDADRLRQPCPVRSARPNSAACWRNSPKLANSA